MNVLDDNNETIREIYRCLDKLSEHLDKIVKKDCSSQAGDCLLDNAKLAELLNVSQRTLQEWRNLGVIPFIQIRGKILYRKVDIDRVLQNNYYGEYRY